MQVGELTRGSTRLRALFTRSFAVHLVERWLTRPHRRTQTRVRCRGWRIEPRCWLRSLTLPAPTSGRSACRGAGHRWTQPVGPTGFGVHSRSCFEQGVGQHHELAYDGRGRDLGRLATVAQFKVLAGEVRLVGARAHRSHEEHPSRPRPPAADEAASLPGARLPRDGRQTQGQMGHPLLWVRTGATRVGVTSGGPMPILCSDGRIDQGGSAPLEPPQEVRT